MNSELYHYGTPRHSGRYPYGSGKRPYQGEKHSITRYTDNIDKHKQHNKDVNYIYDTFSNVEKNFISSEPPDDKPPKYYYNPKQQYDTQHRIYADVLKIRDVPVAFIEYWSGHIEDEEILDVFIGVINDERYRHAGYASRMAEKGNKEIQKIIKSGVLNKPIDRIIWGADSENLKSIQTAMKLGFEEDPEFEFISDKGRTYKGFQKKINK